MMYIVSSIFVGEIRVDAALFIPGLDMCNSVASQSAKVYMPCS